MLVSQSAHGGMNRRQGRRGVSLAELRRQLATPSGLGAAHRQRLIDLRRRLERVQAAGGEYARVSISDFVVAATDCRAAAV
jgi:hypothetical protein